MTPGAGNEPIRVFVSYARKDRRWLDEDNPHNLIPWLIDSLRKHSVVFWFDQDLVPSEVYSQRIADEIARADIAILMVSQRFLNSVYIEQNELPPIKVRARQGTLAVLPILLERCAWEEDEFLYSRQMLPGKPTPLIKYVGNDAEWADVRYELLDGIKMLIRNIRTARLQGGAAAVAPAPPAAAGAEAPPPGPEEARGEPPPAPLPPPVEVPDAGAVAGRFCVLEIESDPPGAEVIIDGGAFEAKAPEKIKRVPWGRHHYDAVLEGERRLSYFDVRDFACRVLIEFPQSQQRRAEQEAEKALWEKTSQADSEDGCKAYLSETRLGLHRAEAEGILAERAAERARREDEERRRLEKEAAAERAREAAERKEEALWTAARGADSEEAYAGYLESSRLLAHKDEAVRRAAELAAGRERRQAERKEAALWRKAEAEDTEESYAAYLAGSRLLANQAQAQARIEELRAECVRREEEKARKRREREAAAKAAREEELRRQALLREQQDRKAKEQARLEAEALAARQEEERRLAELKRQRLAVLAREEARLLAESAAAAKREAETREAEGLRKLEEQRERERIEVEAQKRRAEQIARQQKKEAEAAAALKEDEQRQAELKRRQEEVARAQARLPHLVSYVRPLVPADEEPRGRSAPAGRSLGGWFKVLLAPAQAVGRADDARGTRAILDTVATIKLHALGKQLLSEGQVRAKTVDLRERLARGETPDAILVDAFAAVMSTCRRLCGTEITLRARKWDRHTLSSYANLIDAETLLSWNLILSKRTWTYIPTDAQLACGVAMLRRKVVEAPAREDRWIASIAPAYLHALAGRGVHVVTAADRDAAECADWMGAVVSRLGMTAGWMDPDLAPDERRAQYACDITCGSAAEFCADYLRDSMARRAEDRVQRGLHAAIVCDADSILIDEAFTSRTISRLDLAPPGERPWARLKPAVEALVRAQEKAPAARTEDRPFVVDERARTVSLTDKGRKALNAAEGDLPAVHALLSAYCLYRRDVDYIVEENRVVIVDGTTGRALRGHRWSDGLHQAVETKENLPATEPVEILRAVTHRGYFRLYPALAGFAADVESDGADYEALYKLGVFPPPVGMSGPPPAPRTSIYRTRREQLNAVVEEIAQRRQKDKQPILVRAPSIEAADLVSRLLRRKSISHGVLHAMTPPASARDALERAVAQGSVTISTDLLSRWAGPKAHGSADVGGLDLFALERHPVRRADLQWRGLPGLSSAHFIVSLEDDLMRRIEPGRIAPILGGAPPVEGEELKQEALKQLVEQAQEEAGEALSRARRREVGFDDVLDGYRETMCREYAAAVAHGVDRGQLLEKVSALMVTRARQCLARGSAGAAEFSAWVVGNFPVAFKPPALSDAETLARTVIESFRKAYELKCALEKPEDVVAIERSLLLDAVDGRWRTFLRETDGLRAVADDPAGGRRATPEEFARRAADAFDSFRSGVIEDMASRMFRVAAPSPRAAMTGASPAASASASASVSARREVPGVGRNDPCPCGSGQKYKKCCGRE